MVQLLNSKYLAPDFFHDYLTIELKILSILLLLRLFYCKTPFMVDTFSNTYHLPSFKTFKLFNFKYLVLAFFHDYFTVELHIWLILLQILSICLLSGPFSCFFSYLTPNTQYLAHFKTNKLLSFTHVLILSEVISICLLSRTFVPIHNPLTRPSPERHSNEHAVISEVSPINSLSRPSTR